MTSTPTPRRTRCRSSTSAGYVNQASDDPKDVSYEFGSTAGSLDHVLASPAAADMVTGRDVWQINAEESVGFEYSRYNYNATLLYQPNQFRASDHNPELVGLGAPFTQEASTVSVTATPDRIKKKKDTTRIDVTVSAAEATPTGLVAILVGGEQLAVRQLVDGHASATLGPFPRAGTETVRVLYLGDQVTRPGTARRRSPSPTATRVAAQSGTSRSLSAACTRAGG